jgi:hypothetical protein
MDSPDPDDLELIERQLKSLPRTSAPANLRSAVLGNVHRSLKAQRWDRRLARAAVTLLAVGVGLNATAGWQGPEPAANRAVTDTRPDVIARIAVLMSEATDAETARQFARHLAMLDGTTLNPQQEAAIQKKIDTSKTAAAHRKDG